MIALAAAPFFSFASDAWCENTSFPRAPRNRDEALAEINRAAKTTLDRVGFSVVPNRVTRRLR